MKVYTIFYKGTDSRYGYESSQVSRQKIFDKLGIQHTLVLGLPLPYPNWRERMENIGYSNYISTCNMYSDIANDDLSLTFEDYKKDKNIEIVEENNEYLKIIEDSQEKTIYLTKEEAISHIEDDENIYFYTSDLYLKKEKSTANLYWYNKDKSLALRGEPGIKADYIFYDKENNRIGNTDTLMRIFLTKNLENNDVLIYDPLFNIAGDLKRFLRMKRIRTYQVIHYNILDPQFSHMIPALKPWLKYIAASEKLVQPLRNVGIDIDFLPPMHTEKIVEKKHYASITNYCLVGSYSYIKRIEMAVGAFANLEKQGIDVNLTIYGGDKEDIEDFKKENYIPGNVKFVERVDRVPYEKHQAYLSCSQSECFANAMVEASSHSLAILASNVDLAHRHYASLSENLKLFDKLEDLVALIQDLVKNGANSATEIAENYTQEKVEEMYKKLFVRS
ncbi:MAG: glycosyltransferase [Gemella sp.]|nr:glycosyltransferase [Gemella sp.]